MRPSPARPSSRWPSWPSSRPTAVTEPFSSSPAAHVTLSVRSTDETDEKGSLTASERQRLGPPVHLGTAVLGDRLDRRAGQRLVCGEQPAQGLGLVEAAVEEQGECAVQAPDDLAAVEEGRGHAERAVRALDGHQLAVAEQLLD